MGGEKQKPTVSRPPAPGSPPHGRGKVMLRVVVFALGGITPAWAGKRATRSAAGSGSGDHPRVGGEKCGMLSGSRCRTGSPPHGRGKVFVHQVPPFDVGITPRIGGEKCSLSSFLTRCSGLPPHGRGKGNRGFSCVSSKRITPAWAGKRCLLPFLCSDSWDHPRVGGEKVQILLYEDIQKGSPPRGRGKARHLSHGLLPCG